MFWNENSYWYRFLMSGMVHSVTATVANVHDISEADKLIRTNDRVVYGIINLQLCNKREDCLEGHLHSL